MRCPQERRVRLSTYAQQVSDGVETRGTEWVKIMVQSPPDHVTNLTSDERLMELVSMLSKGINATSSRTCYKTSPDYFISSLINLSYIFAFLVVRP